MSNDELRYTQEFLVRFGYLRREAYQPGTLDRNTSEALTKYQAYHHSRVTGRLDEATIKVMSTARCAHPDLDNGLAFVVACAWDRSALTFAFDTDTSDLPAGDAFQAVRNAFQTWSNTIPLDDTEHTWVNGAATGGFDVESVALHEIGHIIGLQHSNVAGSGILPMIPGQVGLGQAAGRARSRMRSAKVGVVAGAMSRPRK